jgi:uncharacterized damage-inducible protein DinB
VNPVIGDICRQHLEFMKWADNLMLAAITAQMPARKETLEHIFMAERIWLARVRDTVNAKLLIPPPDPETLAAEWSDLHGQWLKWAEEEQDWGKILPYKTLTGVESQSTLWQIVLHVTNHGSYHRGQVASALRAAGFTPPSTDLILWYRQQGG